MPAPPAHGNDMPAPLATVLTTLFRQPITGMSEVGGCWNTAERRRHLHRPAPRGPAGPKSSIGLQTLQREHPGLSSGYQNHLQLQWFTGKEP